MTDKRDYTGRYNTKLTPEQEAAFQKAYPKPGDLYDYDLRGAFKANGFQPMGPGHMTDKFKKPNHPTFSDQSQYDGSEGIKGGKWGNQPDGSFNFTPGKGNVYSPDELKSYFDKQEKGNKLIMSPQSAISDPVQAAIIKAAREGGVDPKYALAIAQRESNFDPNARSSKTISGVFQMRGDHRMAHGAGSSNDPYTQSKAWTGFIKDVKGEMKSVLGRDPTDAESYLGHHFGGVRAARMMGMDPSTPVDSVFTPREMKQNPHFAHAGTVGALNGSVMADIEKRAKTFDTGPAPLPSSYGEPVKTLEAGPASMEQPTAAPSPLASVPKELLARLDQAPPQSGVGRDAPPAAAPTPMDGIGQALAPPMAATIPSELVDRLNA